MMNEIMYPSTKSRRRSRHSRLCATTGKLECSLSTHVIVSRSIILDLFDCCNFFVYPMELFLVLQEKKYICSIAGEAFLPWFQANSIRLFDRLMT